MSVRSRIPSLRAVHGPRNFAKSDVLLAQLVWAAENETLKNYGVNASGSSSSVAQVWRGVAGIDREGVKICCFFMFSIDCARGCLGRLGWLVCADCSSTLKYRATARICVRQVQVFTSSMAPFSGFHFPLPTPLSPLGDNPLVTQSRLGDNPFVTLGWQSA